LGTGAGSFKRLLGSTPSEKAFGDNTEPSHVEADFSDVEADFTAPAESSQMVESTLLRCRTAPEFVVFL